MGNFNLQDDIIFPDPETRKELELYKTLQDNHRSIVDSFSSIENTATEAGTGLTDTDGVYSVDVDDSTIQVGASGIEVIPGGVDHNSLDNTHNLTTDIDHNTITNNHNLTTDIDHDQLTNFTSAEHFTMLDEDDMASDSNTQCATQQSIKAYISTNASVSYQDGTDYIEASATTTRSTSSNTYVKLKEFSILTRGGTISVVWDARSTDDGQTKKSKVYVNSIAVGTEKTVSSNVFAAQTESGLSVEIGDVIQIYGYVPATETGSLEVENAYIKCLNPTIPQEVSGY